MILARVDGTIVATVAHPSLHGCRTIVCQPLDEHDQEEGTPFLALDPLSAGHHERVLVATEGGYTRTFLEDPKSPLRNLVVAIVNPPPPEDR